MLSLSLSTARMFDGHTIHHLHQRPLYGETPTVLAFSSFDGPGLRHGHSNFAVAQNCYLE